MELLYRNMFSMIGKCEYNGWKCIKLDITLENMVYLKMENMLEEHKDFPMSV